MKIFPRYKLPKLIKIADQNVEETEKDNLKDFWMYETGMDSQVAQQYLSYTLMMTLGGLVTNVSAFYLAH